MRVGLQSYNAPRKRALQSFLYVRHNKHMHTCATVAANMNDPELKAFRDIETGEWWTLDTLDPDARFMFGIEVEWLSASRAQEI